MSAARIHSTITRPTRRGWGWHCEDCPAHADGYDDKERALRVASIHEDPSETQGSHPAAATKKR